MNNHGELLALASRRKTEEVAGFFTRPWLDPDVVFRQVDLVAHLYDAMNEDYQKAKQSGKLNETVFSRWTFQYEAFKKWKTDVYSSGPFGINIHPPTLKMGALAGKFWDEAQEWRNDLKTWVEFLKSRGAEVSIPENAINPPGDGEKTNWIPTALVIGGVFVGAYALRTLLGK